MVKFSGPPQASHSTSPDSLVERVECSIMQLREMGRRTGKNLLTLHDAIEVMRDQLARVSSDSELLRLADDLAQMVTQTPNKYTVGDVTDTAERYRRARREGGK